jgi:hypothetical protein
MFSGVRRFGIRDLNGYQLYFIESLETSIARLVLMSLGLARTCKTFRNRRPRSASNDLDAGEPTPIFRGRPR